MGDLITKSDLFQTTIRWTRITSGSKLIAVYFSVEKMYIHKYVNMKNILMIIWLFYTYLNKMVYINTYETYMIFFVLNALVFRGRNGQNRTH